MVVQVFQSGDRALVGLTTPFANVVNADGSDGGHAVSSMCLTPDAAEALAQALLTAAANARLLQKEPT